MKVRNELSGKHIPLLEKEGWMRGSKISRSHLSPRRQGGKPGEIIRPERFRRTDHPVCGNSVASRYLIYAAATPPFQGGECCLIPIHSRFHRPGLLQLIPPRPSDNRVRS